MTIESIAKKLIKKIKSFPEEARHSQDGSGPKTSWDEYKEQIQYEEYDSFEVFKETIENMVENEVLGYSDHLIEKLYRSRYNNDHYETIEDKKMEVINLIFTQIDEEALNQNIEYNKPEIDFVRYFEDDLTVIAEVIMQVDPEEFLIHSYSEQTGIRGEQKVNSLSYLDDECGLERISQEEFNEDLKKLKDLLESAIENEAVLQEHDTSEDGISSIYSSSLESENPVLYANDSAKTEETNYEHSSEEARIKKAVIDLIKIRAKAENRTPLEIIREMKYDLDERRLARESKINKLN